MRHIWSVKRSDKKNAPHFKLKSASWLVNNKITGKKPYLLDWYIFAALLETTYLTAFVD